MTAIAGKVGGNIFSRALNGNYLKRQGRVVNRRSISQMYYRSQFVAITSSWRSIGSVNQTSWNALALITPYVNSLGVTSYYSGFQLFSKYNMQLSFTNNAFISTAPGAIGFSNYTWQQCTYSIGGAQANTYIYFNETLNTTIPSGYTLVIKATPPLSVGVGFPKESLYRTVGIISENTDTAALDISAAYTEVFGQTPPLNASIYCQVFLVWNAGGQRASNVSALMVVSA